MKIPTTSVAFLAVVLLATMTAQAATFTFVPGNANDWWVTASNWDLPGIPNSINDVAVFDASANPGYSTNTHSGNPYTVQELRYNTTSTWRMHNNERDINLEGPGTSALVTQNGSGAITFDCDLRFGDTTTFTGSGTGDITVNGSILGGAAQRLGLFGPGGLIKEGSYTLTVNPAGSYAGGTTINQGTIVMGNNAALGTGPVTINTGGTLNAAGTNPANAITINGGTLWTANGISGQITLNDVAGNQIFASGNYRVLSGQITGAGGVTFGGSGTPGITLTNSANDFQGDVTINGGSYLRLTASEVIPDTAIVNVLGNLRVEGGGNTETIAGLTGGGSVWIPTSANDYTLRVGFNDTSSTFTGSISPPGQNTTISLVKIGDGTLTLGGSLGHTSGTTVDGGVLVMNRGGLPLNGGSNGQFGSSGQTVTVNDGATLRLANNWVTGGGQQHELVANGGTIDFNGADNYQSKITLTGGHVTTSGGTHPWRFGNFGNALVTVNASDDESTIQGTLCFVKYGSGGTATFDVADGNAANDLVLSAVVYDHPGNYGGMKLVKTGAGTMVVTGNNTYVGGTMISQGTLQLGAGGTTGSILGTVTLGDANTGANDVAFLVNRSDTNTQNNNLVVSSLGTGTATIGSSSTAGGPFGTIFTGTMTLNRPTTMQGTDPDRTSFTNLISGNVGTLTVNGGARTTWEAGNTFVGNVDIQGAGTVLQIGGGGGAQQIPNASNVNIGTGARLHLVYDDETVNGLTGTGTVAFYPGGGLGATTLTIGAGNADATFDGLIENGSGTALRLVKIGSGTQTLTNAANSFTGGLFINGGTLSTTDLSPGNEPSGIGGWLGTSAYFGLDGGTLQYTGGTVGDVNRAFTLNAGGGTIDIANAATTVTWTDAAFAGPITGPGSLTKTGPGTLVLAGALAHTGGTTVDEGILRLSANVGFPGTGSTGQFTAPHTITVNDGATLEISGNWGTGDGQQHELVANGGTIAFAGADNYQSKITLTGGHVTTSGGTRPWRTGNYGPALITVNPSATASTIDGTLCFVGTGGGPTTTFNVADGAAADDLIVSALIYDHPGFERQMRVVKNGAGKMVLSANNTFAGGVTINDGILSVTSLAPGNDPSALGAAYGNAPMLVFDGGTLEYTGGTVGGINRAFTLNAGGGTIDITGAATTVTWTDAAGAGPITGPGMLTKAGPGTLVLAGNNNYSGGTTVSQGTLYVQNNNGLGSGTVTLGDANTGTDEVRVSMLGSTSWPGGPSHHLDNDIIVSNLAGGRAVIAGLGGTYASVYRGTVTLQNKDVVFLHDRTTDRTAIEGKITGTGNVTIEGGGRVNFADAGSDFVGDVTIVPGATLQTVLNDNIPDTADVTVNGRLGLYRTNDAIDALHGNGLVNTWSGGGAVRLTVGADNGSGIFSGSIQNGGGTLSLVKTGAGTQTLSGNGGAYVFGGATVDDGVLELKDNGSGGGNGFRTAVVNNATVWLTASSGQTSDLRADISGTGSVVKKDTGTVRIGTFSGLPSLTYTGDTIVEAGTLDLQGQAAGPGFDTTGDLVINPGASFLFSGLAAQQAGNAARFGALRGSGNLGVGWGTHFVEFGNGDKSGEFSGAISGALTVTKTGTGTQTFSGNGGAYVFTGVNVDDGVLELKDNGNGGGNGFRTSVVNNADLWLTSTGPASDFRASISGTGTITKKGPGMVRLGPWGGVAQVTGSGDVIIESGTLQSAGRSDYRMFDTTGDLVINPGATFDYSALNDFSPATASRFGALSGSGDITVGWGTHYIQFGNGDKSGEFSGTISGDLSVSKIGTGTQTLIGNNTYTGTTTVDNGTLLVDGSVGGSVIVNPDGIVSAGQTVGQFVVGGTYDQTGTMLVEINGYSQGTDPGYDYVDVSGAANVGGFVDIDLLDGFLPSSGTTFDVLTATSVIDNGIQLTWDDSLLLPAQHWTYSIPGGDTLQLQLAVPEPSTLVLAALGLLGLGLARRRRRRTG